MIARARQGPEVRTHLVSPACQVRVDDARLRVVGDLDRAEGVGPAAPPKLAAAGGAQVAHPLGVPARRDEVPGTLELQAVDWHPAPLPTLTARATARAQGTQSHISSGLTPRPRTQPGLR